MLDSTLREDYEIHINSDGVFYIGYSASCKVCGFYKEFNRTENVVLNGK